MTDFLSETDGELILDNTQPSETTEPTSWLPVVRPYVTMAEYWRSLSDGELFRIWDRDFEQYHIKANSQKVNLKRYFLTFTRDPNNGTKFDWFKLLEKSLNQKLHNFVTATIEHVDTNVHCHAIVESKYNLSKDRYKKFTSQHRMDIKKLKWDNGVKTYMSKENVAIDTLEEFMRIYSPIFEKIN